MLYTYQSFVILLCTILCSHMLFCNKIESIDKFARLQYCMLVPINLLIKIQEEFCNSSYTQTYLSSSKVRSKIFNLENKPSLWIMYFRLIHADSRHSKMFFVAFKSITLSITSNLRDTGPFRSCLGHSTCFEWVWRHSLHHSYVLSNLQMPLQKSNVKWVLHRQLFVKQKQQKGCVLQSENDVLSEGPPFIETKC